MIDKYTKTELIDLVSARLMTSDVKVTKKDLYTIFTEYEHAIYNVLENGYPVTLGRVGTFRFYTIKEQKGDHPFLPKYEAHTKVKFKINKYLQEAITKKTSGNPWDTHTSRYMQEYRDNKEKGSK